MVSFHCCISACGAVTVISQVFNKYVLPAKKVGEGVSREVISELGPEM